MDPLRNQATLLRKLAHPTRLAVLEILRDGEQCVCHMEATLGIRQAALSQQLMVLRDAGLVRVRRDGLNIFYRVTRPEVFKILDAVGAGTGRNKSSIRHRHASEDCPCPKCNAPSPTSVRSA